MLQHPGEPFGRPRLLARKPQHRQQFPGANRLPRFRAADAQPGETEQVTRDIIRSTAAKARRIAVLAPHPVVLRDDTVMKQVEESRHRFGTLAILRNLVDEIRRHAGIDAVQPKKRRAHRRRHRRIVQVVFDRIDLAVRKANACPRAKAHGLSRR